MREFGSKAFIHIERGVFVIISIVLKENKEEQGYGIGIVHGVRLITCVPGRLLWIIP